MLNISGIENGIVLDHIPAGKAMDLYRYLHLGNVDNQVAIIKNASSQLMGKKDIIKIECGLDEIDLDVIGFINNKITVNVIQDGKTIAKIQVADFKGVPAVPLVLAFDHGISVRSRACAAVRGGKCIPDDMLPQVGMGHHGRCVLLRGAEYGRQHEKNHQQRYQQSQYFFHGNAQSSGRMFWGTGKKRKSAKSSEQNVSPGSVDPGETELLYFYRGILSFSGIIR